MEIPDNLFLLIKSLSKSEKKHFKRFVLQYYKGKESIYVRLFDVIHKQKQYDKGNIISKIPLLTSPSRLSKEKSNLYGLILKSLANSRPNRSKNIQLKDILISVEILYEKALFGQCVKLLKKAKKMAYSYEKDSHLFEVFKWEKKLFYSGEKINLQEVLKEELLISNKRKNVFEYDNLLLIVFKLTKGEGQIRNENAIKKLNKITDNPLLSSIKNAQSFDAKLRFYNIYSLCYQATGNLSDSCEICKKWVALLESRRERINEAPFKYITALNNLLLSQDKFNDREEYLVSLQKLKYVTHSFQNARTERVKAAVFTRFNTHALSFFNCIGKFEANIAVVPVIEKGLQQFKEKLDKKHELSMILQIANAYFATNDYYKATEWLEKILDDTEVDIREDIHHFARILNLMINYEQHKEDMPEYLVQSTYRYLVNRKPKYGFEPIILKFFRVKVFKAKTHNELIEAFKELRKTLSEILKDPFERKALDYFDFISWLQSKIEKKPMTEIIQDKLNLYR